MTNPNNHHEVSSGREIAASLREAMGPGYGASALGRSLEQRFTAVEQRAPSHDFEIVSPARQQVSWPARIQTLQHWFRARRPVVTRVEPTSVCEPCC